MTVYAVVEGAINQASGEVPMADINSTTIKLSQISFEGSGQKIIDSIVSKVAEFINTILSFIFPGHEGLLVLLLSIAWALMLRKRFNLGIAFTAFHWLIFFSFLKYFGIGG